MYACTLLYVLMSLLIKISAVTTLPEKKIYLICNSSFKHLHCNTVAYNPLYESLSDPQTGFWNSISRYFLTIHDNIPGEKKKTFSKILIYFLNKVSWAHSIRSQFNSGPVLGVLTFMVDNFTGLWGLISHLGRLGMRFLSANFQQIYATQTIFKGTQTLCRYYRCLLELHAMYENACQYISLYTVNIISI